MKMNGDQVTGSSVEYGVRHESSGEVIDFGDDLLGAGMEATLTGGIILERKVYLTEWKTSDRQPVVPALDDETGGEN